MTWKITNGERFVSWEQRYSADPLTAADIEDLLVDGVGVLATPTGPLYRVHGAEDELGIFLLAESLLDAGTVTGIPPSWRQEPKPLPDGAVA